MSSCVFTHLTDDFIQTDSRFISFHFIIPDQMTKTKSSHKKYYVSIKWDCWSVVLTASWMWIPLDKIMSETILVLLNLTPDSCVLKQPVNVWLFCVVFVKHELNVLCVFFRTWTQPAVETHNRHCPFQHCTSWTSCWKEEIIWPYETEAVRSASLSHTRSFTNIHYLVVHSYVFLYFRNKWPVCEIQKRW